MSSFVSKGVNYERSGEEKISPTQPEVDPARTFG